MQQPHSKPTLQQTQEQATKAEIRAPNVQLRKDGAEARSQKLEVSYLMNFECGAALQY